jgi:hypothetical protein
MIALEKDGNVLYQGSWSRRLQEMLGLRGNAQPALPYTTDSGTLRAVEFVKTSLLSYQQKGAESGVVDGDVWRITTSVTDVGLSQAKEIALAQISRTRHAVETGGVIVNGKFYSTDRDSQAAISRASGTVNWKCHATVTRKIDDVDTVCFGAAEFVSSDMDAVKTAVAKHVADAYAREAELMEAINSADSVGALRLSPDGKSGIDLTAGWASVPPPDPGE